MYLNQLDVGQLRPSVRRMYPRDNFQASLGDRLCPCDVTSALILAFAEYRFEAGFTLLTLSRIPKEELPFGRDVRASRRDR